MTPQRFTPRYTRTQVVKAVTMPLAIVTLFTGLTLVAGDTWGALAVSCVFMLGLWLLLLIVADWQGSSRKGAHRADWQPKHRKTARRWGDAAQSPAAQRADA
jgi:hypothetical protein